MFYITTEGALFVEGRSRVGTGIFPSRKIITHTFEPCPVLPESPQKAPLLPWRFSFTSDMPPGDLRTTREMAIDDRQKLGGCVLLDTPWEKSYAKHFILEKLIQARS